MAKMSLECPSAAFIFLSEDDENVSQMKYLHSSYKQYDSQAVLNQVVDLKLLYDQNCNPKFTTQGNIADCLFNVYPKEWLITEITQDGLLKYDFENLRSIEPFWKLIASNKAMLPLLWSLYPGHPNLLPSYYDDPFINDRIANMSKEAHWVSKPLFGREGLGVFMSNNFSSYKEFVETTENNFGRDAVTYQKLGKSIYQQYKELPVAQGRVIQASSWVIYGMPVGLAFREGKAGDNFGDLSPFLVHNVRKNDSSPITYKFEQTLREYEKRKRLYSNDYDNFVKNELYSQNEVAVKYGLSHILPEDKPVYSSEFGSKPHSEWAAYKELPEISDPQQSPSSLDWIIPEDTVRELQLQKCCIEIGFDQNLPQCSANTLRRMLQSDSSANLGIRFIFSADNKDFMKKREQRFGQLAKSTFVVDAETGGANWYSVDYNGYIRIHSWHTMGYGRSWGKG